MKSKTFTLILIFVSVTTIARVTKNHTLVNLMQDFKSVYEKENINILSEEVQRTQVLYDSLVKYIFKTDSDSIGVEKTTFFYDSVWNKVQLEHLSFWNEEYAYWYNAEKKEYKYDQQGNKILYAHYFYNQISSSWIGDQKEEHVFSDTLIVHMQYNRWNKLRNDFEGSYKIEYFLEPDGKIKQARNSLWDTIAHSWYYKEMIESDFDQTGKQIFENVFTYDTTIHNWKATRKLESFYSQNGADSLKFGYKRNPEDDDWINSLKTEYQYTDTSKSVLYYRRISNNDAWEISSKDEEAWDSSGNVILRRSFNWNTSNSEWIGVFQQTFSYDDFNRCTETIQYLWEPNSYSWLNDYKEVEEHDDEGHVIHKGLYRWSNYWEVISEADYVFSDNGNLLSVQIGENLTEYLYNNDNILLAYSNYLDTYIDKQLRSRGFYYWNQVITPIESGKYEDIIQVLPNPASDVIRISGMNAQSQIRIFDLQGKIRLQRKVFNGDEIDIKQLFPGTYLLLIESSEGTMNVKKLIKK